MELILLGIGIFSQLEQPVVFNVKGIYVEYTLIEFFQFHLHPALQVSLQIENQYFV